MGDGFDGAFDYESFLNYGNTTPNYDYTQTGSGMMPGMTKNSPSYGSSQSMNYQAPGLNSDKSWWGNASGMQKLTAVGQGVEAFSTLASLYLGFKGLKEHRKQFKFTKSAWNKNFSAQLGAYDNSLRDNYEKYRAGNEWFGNPYKTEDEWMSERSLSHLGT